MKNPWEWTRTIIFKRRFCCEIHFGSLSIWIMARAIIVGQLNWNSRSQIFLLFAMPVKYTVQGYGGVLLASGNDFKGCLSLSGMLRLENSLSLYFWHQTKPTLQGTEHIFSSIVRISLNWNLLGICYKYIIGYSWKWNNYLFLFIWDFQMIINS